MNLPLPTYCSLKMVDDIVAERQRGKNAGTFGAISSRWKARVQEYLAHGGSPESVLPWIPAAPAKGTFLNLYKSPGEGSVQGDMLKALRKHALVLCPACGEAGKPNTLDHYLPKDAFPHFAVTPANLFPMCDACQGEKLEKTGDAASPRYFLHPYFDGFLNQTLFVLRIAPPYNTPTFDLQVCPTLPPDQSRLVATHMRELAMKRRFTHFAVAQHIRMLKLASDMHADRQDVASRVASFRDLYAHPSRNSWEYVYFDAVLSDAALLEHLRSGPLPSSV